jgi:hypothetical protein
MRFLVPLMLAHVIPALVFLLQDALISASFHSQCSWLFYLFLITGTTGFSLLGHAFVKRAFTSQACGEMPTGILPICSKCNSLM